MGRQEAKVGCGFGSYRPLWLQKYAKSRWFMIVYGLLGMVQATGYLYFIVTLTTIERRFKIPSQTTGIVLSGNEVSQIMLSLILSYAGGQRNRPRWIAWGVIFCSLSCFILAAPHFVFGAGEDILQYTEEYITEHKNLLNVSIEASQKSQNKKLCLAKSLTEEDECNEVFSYLPLILIFLSQFVLGIGNTLYYSLGQSYLDDNIRKTNSPLMLAYTMCLRMFGPVVGFFLGYFSLNTFIDPTKTPVINKKDPRWLGAWWLGWIILGSLMFLFAFLIGLFPKNMKKSDHRTRQNDDEEVEKEFIEKPIVAPTKNKPQMKDFPAALMRLLTNKLLMYNLVAGIFYLLAAHGYMTYMSRYIEVQFNRVSSEATIVTGPLTIIGMVAGFLISGYMISHYRPRPRVLFFWNLIVGVICMLGQFSYSQLTCDAPESLVVNEAWTALPTCSSHCHCDSVSYTPVCHTLTQKTYFSPCHAGCTSYNETSKTYLNCSCAIESIHNGISSIANYEAEEDDDGVISAEEESVETGSRRKRSLAAQLTIAKDSLFSGSCAINCERAFWTFTSISLITNFLGSTGRIGNILLNFRAVDKEDKSFSQGLALTLVSLLALIPGPIIYGMIIDGTCLIWSQKCGERGNCQLYDKDKFRFNINMTAVFFTALGISFDVLVWYYSKNLVLYDDAESTAGKPIAPEAVESKDDKKTRN